MQNRFTVLLQVLNHIKRVACDKKICAAAEMNEVAYWVYFVLWEATMGKNLRNQ